MSLSTGQGVVAGPRRSLFLRVASVTSIKVAPALKHPQAKDGPERWPFTTCLAAGFKGPKRAWESATDPATRRGIRTVQLRIGTVLSPDGGAMAQMRTPFRLGLGGVLGDGRQYMS
jgi:hypothetical protein